MSSPSISPTIATCATIPEPITEFFHSGPLRVTDLTQDFPLREVVETHCPTRQTLQSIERTSYPNEEVTKSYSPAFKRYTGQIQQQVRQQVGKAAEDAGHAGGGGDTKENPVPVFFKLTGLLDANALVCGKYDETTEDSLDTKDVGDTDNTDKVNGVSDDATDRATVATTDHTPNTNTLTNILDQVHACADVPPIESPFGVDGQDADSSFEMFQDTRDNEITDRAHKTQATHNTAYIDSLASCLTSRLVEDNVCPHFPRVYGVYQGTADKHHVEFTEEYFDHRYNRAFQKGVDEQRWAMVPGPPEDSGDEFGESGSDDASEGGSEGAESGEDVVEKEDGEDKEDDTNESKEEDSNNSDSDAHSTYTNDSLNESLDPAQLTAISLTEIDSIPDADSGTSVEERPDAIQDGCPDESQNEFQSLSQDGFQSLPQDLLTSTTFLQDLETIDDPLPRRTHDGGHYVDQPHYLDMRKVPVQVVAMEAFDVMFEDAIRNDFRELKRCETLVAREQFCDADDTEDASTLTTSGTSGTISPVARYAAFYWLRLYRTRSFERKWTAILAQVNMALVAMQHRYDMVHNDLHGQNILLAPTSYTHLQYEVNGTRYRVPTYGYIAKLIDMGRTTFQLDNTLYMGDVYHPKGEAGEQYSYIHHHESLSTDAEARQAAAEREDVLLPNPGFDLARLACSLLDEFYNGGDPYRIGGSAEAVNIPEAKEDIEEDEDNEDDVVKKEDNEQDEVDEEDTKDKSRRPTSELFQGQPPTVSPFYNMLCEWITDSDRQPINRFDHFDLYKQIARRMRRTVPTYQLTRPHFAQYVVQVDQDTDKDTDNDTDKDTPSCSTWSPVYSLTAAPPAFTHRLANGIDRPPFVADSGYPYEEDDRYDHSDTQYQSQSDSEHDEQKWMEELGLGDLSSGENPLEALMKAFGGAAGGDGGAESATTADPNDPHSTPSTNELEALQTLQNQMETLFSNMPGMADNPNDSNHSEGDASAPPPNPMEFLQTLMRNMPTPEGGGGGGGGCNESPEEIEKMMEAMMGQMGELGEMMKGMGQMGESEAGGEEGENVGEEVSTSEDGETTEATIGA